MQQAVLIAESFIEVSFPKVRKKFFASFRHMIAASLRNTHRERKDRYFSLRTRRRTNVYGAIVVDILVFNVGSTQLLLRVSHAILQVVPESKRAEEELPTNLASMEMEFPVGSER